jgi:hypothetical protein
MLTVAALVGGHVGSNCRRWACTLLLAVSRLRKCCQVPSLRLIHRRRAGRHKSKNILVPGFFVVLAIVLGAGEDGRRHGQAGLDTREGVRQGNGGRVNDARMIYLPCTSSACISPSALPSILRPLHCRPVRYRHVEIKALIVSANAADS